MSKKLGFNISDLLSQPTSSTATTFNNSSIMGLPVLPPLPTPSTSSSSSSSLILPTTNSMDRSLLSLPITAADASSSLTTVSNNESDHQLSNYEQLMRASSIYRNQDYSLLPIVNGTYPWIQTDSILKDRFSLFNNQRRLGHPYQNRTPPKRKKPRTSFTRLQILELEKRFHRQKYLASSERSQLAKGLKMTDAQVKTWFQNRRTKWRRQTAEEREQERQAANRLVLTNSHHRRSSSSSSSLSPSSSPKLTSPSNPNGNEQNNSLIFSSSSLNALQNLQPWSTASNHSNLSSASSVSDESNHRTTNRH